MTHIRKIDEKFYIKPLTADKLNKLSKGFGKVWMRLGVDVIGDKETIEKIIQGDKNALMKLLENGNVYVNGDTYIPENIVEEYNEENGTDFGVYDVEFELG